MYAATFKTENGYIDRVYTIEGATLEKIISRFQAIQDLDSLVRMGRIMGDPTDGPALDRLEKFLEKFYAGKITLEDLRNFTVSLSGGSITCIEVVKKE